MNQIQAFYNGAVLAYEEDMYNFTSSTSLSPIDDFPNDRHDGQFQALARNLALISGAQYGHLELVRWLVDDERADVLFQDYENCGLNALMAASSAGQLSAVSYLLFRGADPNQRFAQTSLFLNMYEGDTALLMAAFGNHSNVVSALVRAKADVNARNIQGSTAMAFLAYHGDTRSIRTLLESRANVNDASEDGFTALMAAARNGHADAVRLLVYGKADVGRQSNAGMTAILAACQGLQRRDVGDDDADDGDGGSDRRAASSREAANIRISMVRFLLTQGGDLSAKTAQHTTCLHIAAAGGNLDLVRGLVDGFRDYLPPLNALDKLGNTAQAIAEQLGYADVAQYLAVATGSATTATTTSSSSSSSDVKGVSPSLPVGHSNINVGNSINSSNNRVSPSQLHVSSLSAASVAATATSALAGMRRVNVLPVGVLPGDADADLVAGGHDQYESEWEAWDNSIPSSLIKGGRRGGGGGSGSQWTAPVAPVTVPLPQSTSPPAPPAPPAPRAPTHPSSSPSTMSAEQALEELRQARFAAENALRSLHINEEASHNTTLDGPNSPSIHPKNAREESASYTSTSSPSPPTVSLSAPPPSSSTSSSPYASSSLSSSPSPSPSSSSSSSTPRPKPTMDPEVEEMLKRSRAISEAREREAAQAAEKEKEREKERQRERERAVMLEAERRRRQEQQQAKELADKKQAEETERHAKSLEKATVAVTDWVASLKANPTASYVFKGADKTITSSASSTSMSYHQQHLHQQQQRQQQQQQQQQQLFADLQREGSTARSMFDDLREAESKRDPPLKIYTSKPSVSQHPSASSSTHRRIPTGSSSSASSSLASATSSSGVNGMGLNVTGIKPNLTARRASLHAPGSLNSGSGGGGGGGGAKPASVRGVGVASKSPSSSETSSSGAFSPEFAAFLSRMTTPTASSSSSFASASSRYDPRTINMPSQQQQYQKRGAAPSSASSSSFGSTVYTQHSFVAPQPILPLITRMLLTLHTVLPSPELQPGMPYPFALELNASSSNSAIKQAYLAALKVVHPDKQTRRENDTDITYAARVAKAETLFQQLRDAFALI